MGRVWCKGNVTPHQCKGCSVCVIFGDEGAVSADKGCAWEGRPHGLHSYILPRTAHQLVRCVSVRSPGKERVCARPGGVGPAWRVEHRLTPGRRRPLRGAQRGGNRGIPWAVGRRQGPPLVCPLRPSLCGAACAAGSRRGPTGDAGAPCVQSQDPRSAGPVTHDCCSPSPAVEGVPRSVGLKRPSLGPCQLLGRVLEGGKVRCRPCVHPSLPKTAASLPKPPRGKGHSKRESLVS